MYQHAPTVQRQSSSAPSRRRDQTIAAGTASPENGADETVQPKTKQKDTDSAQNRRRSANRRHKITASRRKLHSANIRNRSNSHTPDSMLDNRWQQLKFDDQIVATYGSPNVDQQRADRQTNRAFHSPTPPPQQSGLILGLTAAPAPQPDDGPAYIVEQLRQTNESIEREEQYASQRRLSQVMMQDEPGERAADTISKDKDDVKDMRAVEEVVDEEEGEGRRQRRRMTRESSRKEKPQQIQNQISRESINKSELAKIDEEIQGGTPGENDQQSVEVKRQEATSPPVTKAAKKKVRYQQDQDQKDANARKHSPNKENQSQNSKGQMYSNSDINHMGLQSAQLQSSQSTQKQQSSFKQQSSQKKQPVPQGLNSDITNPFPSNTNFSQKKASATAGVGKAPRRSIQGKGIISSNQATLHRRSMTGSQAQPTDGNKAKRASKTLKGETAILGSATKRSEPLINVDETYLMVNDLQNKLKANAATEASGEKQQSQQNMTESSPPRVPKPEADQRGRQNQQIQKNRDIFAIQEQVTLAEQLNQNQEAADQLANGLNKDAQQQEKWKAVMNFMESNPQVMLDFMSQPEEHTAADGLQKQLYNSTSKQYLNSNGNLKYQNYEALGQGSRLMSNDSNVSPNEQDISGLSQEKMMMMSKQAPFGTGKGSFATQRAKSSFMRSQNVSILQQNRDFRIKTNSTLARPTTSTQYTRGLGRQTQQSMYPWNIDRSQKRGTGSLQRPSTTAGLFVGGLGRQRGSHLENLVDRSAQFVGHGAIVGSFGSASSPDSKQGSSAEQLRTKASHNQQSHALLLKQKGSFRPPILEIDKLQFVQDQSNELDYRIRKSKLVYKAQMHSKGALSLAKRMSHPSTAQGSARLRENFQRTRFAYDNQSLLLKRNLAVNNASKQAMVAMITGLPSQNQKKKAFSKMQYPVGFPKGAAGSGGLSQQSYTDIITALDKTNEHKGLSNAMTSAAMSETTNPIDSFIQNWPKPRSGTRTSPSMKQMSPKQQSQVLQLPPSASMASQPSQIATAVQSAPQEKASVATTPATRAPPINSSLNRLDPHKFEKFGQQWLSGAAVGRQQNWIQEAELVLQQQQEGRQQSGTELGIERGLQMFQYLTGKNKHEKRLERLKGLRESMKKEPKSGPKPDAKGEHIISLEQKSRRKTGGKVWSPKMNVVTVVEQQSDGSDFRGSSPQGRRHRKSRKVLKHSLEKNQGKQAKRSNSRSLRKLSGENKKQSSKFDFSKDAHGTSKKPLHSPQADGHLDGELLALRNMHDFKKRPKTGNIKRKTILKDGKKSIITESSKDDQVFKTCDILRKRHKYGTKKTGELYPSSDEFTSHTHETHKIAHRVMGQTFDDRQQQQQSSSGLIKTQTGLVVQQTKHQVDYAMAHEQKKQNRKVFKTDSSQERIATLNQHIGQADLETPLDSRNRPGEEHGSTQLTKSQQNQTVDQTRAQGSIASKQKTERQKVKKQKSKKGLMAEKIIEEPTSSISGSFGDDDEEPGAKKHHPFRKEDEIIVAQSTMRKSSKSPKKPKDDAQSPQEKKTIIVSVKTPDKHIFSEDPKDSSSEEAESYNIPQSKPAEPQRRSTATTMNAKPPSVKRKSSQMRLDNQYETRKSSTIKNQMLLLEQQRQEIMRSSLAQSRESQPHLVVDEVDREESSSQHSKDKSKKTTPRAKGQQHGLQKFHIMQSRAMDRRRLSNKPMPISQKEANEKLKMFENMRFDWSRMPLFRHCAGFKRLERPPTYDETEHQIMSFITILRENTDAYQQAHKLMPMLELGLNYLEDQLCNFLNMEYIFEKVKRQQVTIDYRTTLKVLVRAKLTAQMKEDMTLLICRYLDVLEELRQLQILRDDMASDNFIKDLIHRLYRHAHGLQYHIKKFIIDYPKLFKSGENVIWMGRTDVLKEIEELLNDLTPLVDNKIEYRTPKYKVGPIKLV